MKRFKLTATAIVLLLLPLTIFFASCKKEMATHTENGPVELTTSSVKSSLNTLRHTKQYPSDVANQWFTLLTDIVKTKPYFSPQALRIFAYSGITLYESVVPGMPSYQSMYKYLTGNTIAVDHHKEYYWPACANAAIARISSRIMQDYPAPSLSQVQALESLLNTSFQSEVTPQQLQLSNEFGRQVADIIYDWSKRDGTLNSDGSLASCPAYTPLGGAGSWAPTPPAFLPAAGACQGSLKTFIPNIANTVLAPPPPAYSIDPASEFYQAANEVYQSRNNSNTNETAQFNNWRDFTGNYHPLAHMLRITTSIISKENLNLEDAATIYAKQTMAAFDAIAAVFHSKFHYSLLRPVTYIRNEMGYSTWSSLPNTPQTPSYPDELSATASSVAILEKYVGTNYAFVDSTQKSQYGQWAYSSLNGLLSDVVQARVSGGTIFRFCGEAGIVQGRTVGEMINKLPFKKL